MPFWNKIFTWNYLSSVTLARGRKIQLVTNCNDRKIFLRREYENTKTTFHSAPCIYHNSSLIMLTFFCCY